MKRTTAILACLWCMASLCSDGVDRYRKFGPNTLYLFAEPVPGCGYGVLPKDSEGGADGTVEFRWVQEHMQALVRVCAYETEKELGPAKYPLTIFDGSAENGDTPVDWEPEPRGRHPGGSHDGGINLDLGYYLTSLEGKQFTPDYAACTDHFEPGKEGGLKDAWICNGPADRLDTPRMSYFYIQMFKINREMFGGALLGQIGADYFVKEAVIKQLESWIGEKKHGATMELLDDIKRVITCDEYEGWWGSHHHHTHIRLNDIDLYGGLRPAVEKLLMMEREIDYKLLGGKDDKPVMRARLLSSGLERAMEWEVLGEADWWGIWLKWNNNELSSYGGVLPNKKSKKNREVFPWPNGPYLSRANLEIMAEGLSKDTEFEMLKTQLILPSQDPRLAISIDPARIKVDVSRLEGRLACVVSFPEVYENLVTGVYYEVQSEGRTEKFPTGETGYSAVIPYGFKAPFIIDACVTTCGRKTFRIPIYAQAK